MKPSRRNIIKYLEHIIFDNGGKALYTFHARGLYFHYQRDRGADQSYFRTQIRGNNIVTTRIRYEDKNGKGVNTFIELTIPAMCGEKPNLPAWKKEKILVTPIREYETHVEKLKPLTPSLGWGEWERLNHDNT